MIKILLSKKLGELRLTQADLARATGIRPNTINELYHELADRVNLEHLDLICEALNCELDELIVRIPNRESNITHTRRGNQKRMKSVAATTRAEMRKRGVTPSLYPFLCDFVQWILLDNLYQDGNPRIHAI